MLMSVLMKEYQGNIPSKFQRFERILLHDGSSFAIHDKLKGQLLLADAGYLDQDYYHQIEQHGGCYLVRGKLNLNPTIEEARNGQGRQECGCVVLSDRDGDKPASRKGNRTSP